MLREFWERPGRGDAKNALLAWYHAVQGEDWSTPADVRAFDGRASFVGERVVFNIRGNRYRLVVFIAYQVRTIFVKWIGTHAEYDRIDVEGV